ncbi:MAG: UDP-glucuronic acid decarboxylase family protein [Phototrophicaceae bacterium]
MRVLVAGGAGFVGSHLCEQLLRDGDTVIAMDNLLTGSQQNVAHLEANPNFKFIHHDICQPITLDGTLDAVFNLASPASPPHYLRLKIETLQVGSLGAYNCLELAHQKNARILLSSTSEVYGDPLEHPQKETYFGHVNPIGVRSVYDESKRFAEAMTMAHHRQFGTQTRIVRIFNTYGPRMNAEDGRVVPNFIVQSLKGEPLTIYGDGAQTRSFQYVDDLIRGMRLLLASDYTDPVNIGNPHEMTILQFAETINEITGNTAGIIVQPTERIADDPQRRRPDIARAKAILDWEPQISLHEGLSRTIEYFRKLVIA